MTVLLAFGLALVAASIALAAAMFRRDEPILGVAALVGMLLAAIVTVAYAGVASG